MLKLIYTETGFFLEVLAESTEAWLALHRTLQKKLGKDLLVEPGWASVLLPIAGLEEMAEHVAVCPCDADTFEVSLSGFWVTTDLDDAAVAGVLLVDLPDPVERLILRVWQAGLFCLQI